MIISVPARKTYVIFGLKKQFFEEKRIYTYAIANI